MMFLYICTFAHTSAPHYSRLALSLRRSRRSLLLSRSTPLTPTPSPPPPPRPPHPPRSSSSPKRHVLDQLERQGVPRDVHSGDKEPREAKPHGTAVDGLLPLGAEMLLVRKLPPAGARLRTTSTRSPPCTSACRAAGSYHAMFFRRCRPSERSPRAPARSHTACTFEASGSYSSSRGTGAGRRQTRACGRTSAAGAP